jgi:hypothetical protein
MQPLVVVQVGPITRSQSDRRYRLVAGRRTLQLLLEQHPRDHVTWALCIADEKDLRVTQTWKSSTRCCSN